MSKTGGKITFFLGEDTIGARFGMRQAIEREKAGNESATVTHFDDRSFEPALIREALSSVSLFGGKNIVIIDGILDASDGALFYTSAKELEYTGNIVFVRETSPTKDLQALFKKLGTVHEFPLKKTPEKQNNFAIADAVAAQDKRAAWVEFTKQKRGGAAMEEVHGTIFWAVKSLYLCKTATKEEAIATGMKDYTYRSYRSRAEKYPASELEKKLTQLKDMYHAAREGEEDLGVALEKFLIKL